MTGTFRNRVGITSAGRKLEEIQIRAGRKRTLAEMADSCS